MTKIGFKEANRRYRRVFLPTMIVYAFLAIGGPTLLNYGFETPPKWAMAGMAILTAAPIVLVFVWMWRLVRETDEFTRQRQTSAMAIGGMATASMATIWGFLELFEVVPKVGVFMLGPLFFLNYGLAYAVVFKGHCEPGFGE